MVHHYTHLKPTRRLIPVPVPATHTHKSMSECIYKGHVSNVALVTPEGCSASIKPVVLRRTVSVYLLIALIPTEPDPEVSI